MIRALDGGQDRRGEALCVIDRSLLLPQAGGEEVRDLVPTGADGVGVRRANAVLTHSLGADGHPRCDRLLIGVRAERDMGIDQGEQVLQRVVAGNSQARLVAAADARAQPVDDRQQDLALVAKMIVHETGRETGRARDGGDGGTLIAVPGHHREHGPGDLGASLLGVGWAWHEVYWLRDQTILATKLVVQPIYLFPDALTASEVETLRSAAERRGFQSTGRSYPPGYRDNDRTVIDDGEMAGWLFARLQCHLPEKLNADGSSWQLRGLNRRIRFCRYRDGQAFAVHRDGAHHAHANERSLLTFMVYLNDADEFSGGKTRFYRERRIDSGEFLQVVPRRGTLVAFDHSLWHDGESVRDGTKWVMRSDVMYRRVDAESGSDSAEAEDGTGHLGYIWQLIRRADGRLASCGRDGTVRFWAAPGAQEQRLTPDTDTRARAAPLGDGPAMTGSLTALVENRPGELWVGDRAGHIHHWRAGTWQPGWRAHDGAILALIALPDGRIASASADGDIGLWTPAGAESGRLTGHDGWVWALSARSDGLLASAGEDGTVREWSLASEREVLRRCAPGPVRAVCVTRSWELWAGCADGALVSWDGTRERIRVPAHTGAIRALIELPDGRLASAGEDGLARIFAAGQAVELARYRHEDFVTTLAALPDGRLVSGSYDGTLRVWPARV